MRVAVKKDGRTINELQFGAGPVNIGRRSSSDVSLRDPKVSKKHAIISNAGDGSWTIEDLDSANKTYLNEEPIHKARIKTGDIIRIACFTLEVELEGDEAQTEPETVESASEASEFDDLDIGESQTDELDIGELDAEIDISDIDLSDIDQSEADEVTVGEQEAAETAAETLQPDELDADKSRLSATKISSAETGLLMVAPREPQIIIRTIGAEKAPPIRFDSERVVEYLQVIDAIGKAGSVDEVLLVLLEAVEKQLGACYAWSAVRNKPGGPMTAHAGRHRDGRPLDFEHIPLNEKINEAIEKGEFLLLIFSRDMDMEKGRQVRSALVVPVLSSSGCYGVIYANNTFRDEHYDLGDLDYLMLIAIHAATVLQRL